MPCDKIRTLPIPCESAEWLRALAGLIDKYQRIDDRSFSIRLKAPFAFTEFLLGGSNGVVGAIMREKDAMTDPFTQVKERIGSGPFRFIDAEYRPGAKLVYEKFDGYVPRSEPASGFAGGKVAKVDRVEWVIIPDTSVAFNALRSGEVDMLDAPPVPTPNSCSRRSCSNKSTLAFQSTKGPLIHQGNRGLRDGGWAKIGQHSWARIR